MFLKPSTPKRCANCGEWQTDSRNYCSGCRITLALEQQAKMNARALARVSLYRGRIQRQPCEVCGAWAEMHHDDYSKPKDVRWLCPQHHRDWHDENDPPTAKLGPIDG